VSSQLNFWPGEEGDGLRWSVSRDRRLTDCLRKYYLFHYGSRGGHNADAPPKVRELYVLKTLQSRHMWVGTVVHNMIELALGAFKRGEEVPVDSLVERGTRVMRAQYAESLQGVYRERPMRALGLWEHEYREDISREQWRERRDHMETCIRNFFKLPLLEEIRAAPTWRWLAVESLGQFEVDGAKIVVRHDFALRQEDDQVLMIDWKTGIPRPESEMLQLSVYGIFAQRKWGLGHDHLRGRAVYLGTGETGDFIVRQGDLERTTEAIRHSVRRMRELAADTDTPEIVNFPKTADKSQCSRCAFRRPCGRL